jgi:Flp pilus assembly protein TadD
MSNFFAKFSPDGKWIIFCKAENYMLLMPDSELYIIPAEGGEARRLRANTPLMNSWHSFSSNGRWLVFSSKAFTPYTQLFLTHIDEEGRSTPAVVLDRFTETDRAANIPEFVPLPADSIAKIQERFLDAYSFLRAGMANERTGNYPGAVRSYRRGLEIEPDNVELLNAMGFSLFQQGKSKEAVVAFEKALAVDPKHWKAHNNMALASIDIDELEVAEAHYRESLAIKPQPAIYNDLGFVLERLGMPEQAAHEFRKALELDPESASARYNLGASLVRSGEFAEAERHLREHPDIHRPRGRPVAAGPRGRRSFQSTGRNRGGPEERSSVRRARHDPGPARQARTSRVRLSRSHPQPAQRRRPPGAGPGPDAPRTHGRGAQGDGDGEGVEPEPGSGAVGNRSSLSPSGSC